LVKLDVIEGRGWKLTIEKGENIPGSDLPLPAFYCPDLEVLLSPKESEQWKHCHNSPFVYGDSKEEEHEHFNIIEVEVEKG